MLNKDMKIKRHPKDRGYGYKKSYNYEQSIAEHEDLEPTEKDWQELKEKLPQWIVEACVSTAHCIYIYNSQIP